MTTQPRAEETRASLLRAAAECFARNGYDASSVAEVCAAAGVSKGAFYHHFPTKQALFLALLKQWLDILAKDLGQAQLDSQSVPEELSQMAVLAQSIFAQAGGQLPMFLEFWDQSAHDPAVWQETIAPYRRFRDWFREMIERGIAEGSLRAVDSELAAQVLVAVAMGLLLQGLVDPQGGDWGAAMRGGIEIMLKGLEAPHK